MGFLSGIFGSKPKIPEFKPVDLDKEQLASLENNLKALPNAAKLTKESQVADQETLLQGLRAAIPGYDKMIASEQSVIEQFMGGELPKAVKDRIQNRRAALGLTQGIQGSDAQQHSYARDLGLSELDLVQQGYQMSNAFIGRQSHFMAAPMSVSSMFFTPQQRLAHITGERDSAYTAALNTYKMESAPDPSLGGLLNTAGSILGFDYGKASGGKSASLGGSLLGGIAGLFGGNKSAPNPAGAKLALGGMKSVAGGVANAGIGLATGGPIGGILGLATSLFRKK